MTHWSYGSNVSGYLPESDVGHVETWKDAKAGLAYDIERELDSLAYAPGEDEATDALYASLEEAQRELESAAPGQEFLTYTSDGGQHRIPTAWWIDVCAEDDLDDSES